MVGKAKKKSTKDMFWLDDAEKLKRLSCIIKQEIDRILFDIEFRKEMLIKLWSKERLREPLIKALHSRYADIDFKNLMLLPKGLYEDIDAFYRELDSFTFYVSYTEDMPNTMKNNFETYLKSLKIKSEPVLEELEKISDSK